jgi:protein SCO1/2
VNRRQLVTILAALSVALAWLAWSFHAAATKGMAYDFTLTDQDGHPFRLSQDRGYPVAIFFGYTHCPDQCPATLQHLAAAKRSMGAQGNAVHVIFVTIDPRRDTPQRLRTYLAGFDPSFVGLTGSAAELAPVYRAYHVWYQAVPKTKKDLEAAEAHTSTVYIIDRGGRLRSYADYGDTAQTLAKQLQAAS